MALGSTYWNYYPSQTPWLYLESLDLKRTRALIVTLFIALGITQLFFQH